MNKNYEKLFETYKFKSGATLENRILIAPMTTTSGFENGMTTIDELNYYSRRSGGVGGFITACAYVERIGKCFPGGIAADDDAYILSLEKIANTIKSKGSKAILQIFHGGRMVRQDTIGNKQPVSASNIPAEYLPDVIPREMTEIEVENAVKAFGKATKRAIQAGFDGIEIHGANTYLLQQFFSPHSNRRQDKWGGTLEKRMEFPLAVTDKVLKTVKKYADKPFITGYRFSPEENENPGITLKDTFELIDNLANTELDYLHVSLQNYRQGSIRNSEDSKPVLLRINNIVKNRIAVIGVGGVKTPEDALDMLSMGIPLVALGREIIVEPEWVQKIKNGHESELKYFLDLNRKEELSIPDPMWNYILRRQGWIPVK
ncbi:NADH-dependent flavin oxidoreductase [Leptotrichia sp. OH3620_COT-345]|uniref:NADH-dependent flavin oxidoreductase n=1 Tax=Leptotrichia sp. OH3620_COT-345 TaxID=2491048 RepID=UPI000F6544AC|nr:NADH-dependent flavin oxidoreductase [Leptotrichia sp. OH3620_COT-345]RRD40012.1 NADH-dependent flavin oxidoreductase [Leptotrichia sp. OH3620_COT-345]